MSFSVFQIRVNETGYANPRANHVPLIINAQNISSRGLEIFGFNRNATVLLGKLLHIPKLRVWWKKFGYKKIVKNWQKLSMFLEV